MRIAASVILALLVAAAAQASNGSRSNATEFGIYEIRIDGSGRTALLHNPDIQGVTDISPNRERILFYEYRPDRLNAVYSAAIDGSDVRLIASAPKRFMGPAVWSPGGQRIAIEAADNSACTPTSTGCAVGEIWLTNADGTSLHRLARHAIAPTWSPASRRLAFLGSFSAYGENGIVSAANTTGPVRERRLGPLEFGSWGDWTLVWAPRGDQFGYTTVRRKGEARGLARVAIVDANGPPRHSVRTLHPGTFLTWSPKGKRILYLEGKSHRVIVARPDGRQRRFLTTGYAPVRWSPNGRWIAFVDETQRYCYQLFLIRPDGRDRHQLTDEPCSPRFEIFWSRDSTRLIFPVTTYPHR